MKCHHRRISLLLTLAGLAVAAVPAGALAEEPADTAKAEQGRKKPLPVIWWNDPALVSDVSLSDAQRQSMDEDYRAYLDKLDPLARSTAQKAFFEALAAGDWEDARGKLDQLAEAMTVPVRRHGEIKIRLLEQLSEAQRKRLVDQHPRLLTRPWVKKYVDPSRRPAPSPESE